MSHILIIGGSDAGISAALRIRELDARVGVKLITGDAYPGFSICGLPFFISGEVADWHTLAHHNTREFEQRDIQLLLNKRVTSINPLKNSVSVISNEGYAEEIGYDKLLIATGAESARPPITGLDQRGVFFLRWMKDGFAITDFIEQENPRRVVIIGGGYIGLEMADALKHLGLEVTVLEFLPEILSTMDANMGRLIRNELEDKGVKIITGRGVQKIERNGNVLKVHTVGGEPLTTDMVLVATGVKPSAGLAQSAGIALGVGGAIKVDRKMNTNAADILAAGDCVETWHRILKDNVYMPLGTTAHKQGYIAGENLVRGNHEFQGTLGTQTVKVFDKVAAGTGLRDAQAAKAGFNPLTVTLTTTDRNPYYAGVKEIVINITGDRISGRLLGAQIVGHYNSEISKRIDIIAAGIFNGMTVEALRDLDLSYSPPLSSPWDPVQKAAMEWMAKGNQK